MLSTLKTALFAFGFAALLLWIYRLDTQGSEAAPNSPPAARLADIGSEKKLPDFTFHTGGGKVKIPRQEIRMLQISSKNPDVIIVYTTGEEIEVPRSDLNQFSPFIQRSLEGTIAKEN
jgi:hypothetical protein